MAGTGLSTDMSRRDDRVREGVVVGFDPRSGLGTVRDLDGFSLPFHCVEIADGSRSIAEGCRVTFRVAFRVVRAEAVELRPS